MNCYKKDYPRPQFVRETWNDLNGIWDFSFDDEDRGEKEQWFCDFKKQSRILVPFTYETKRSGIGDEQAHKYVWYHRCVGVDESKLRDHRYMLHFEGSDFYTKLWVNGKYAGSHRGGYSRFSIDISEYVTQGENHIVVKVEDSLDRQQPRGKQRWKNENYGCWYVQTTGIWKSVWSEYVPKLRISDLKMTPKPLEGILEMECGIEAPGWEWTEPLELEADITYKGSPVNRVCTLLKGAHVKIDLDVASEDIFDMYTQVHTWSPEEPNLYDMELKLLRGGEVVDRIGTYFAMREIRIEGSSILLNGKPLYQRLILDQGYWKDSHLTPPDEEALIEDIDKIRALGYNGLRKHQKTEDERFLYWCDVKGMLVWSEAPAAYQYSDRAVELFTEEWTAIVKQNYNHPCIIVWTPFNESWGISYVETDRREQHFTEAIYHLTKSLDPFRPVIVNDGWEHTVSDILTLHDYEEDGEELKARYLDHRSEILSGEICHNKVKRALAKGYRYKGQPVIISEYGGIAFDNGREGWGYGNKVKTAEEFIRRFEAITMAVKELPYVCGYCYTQVSDVQQEINGLLDAERNFKIEPEIIREINER